MDVVQGQDEGLAPAPLHRQPPEGGEHALLARLGRERQQPARALARPEQQEQARRPLLGREPHAGHALAHLPGDGRLVRSLVDAIVLPHDLGHRGCHRGPAAGEAAALTDRDAAATEPATQLAQQPRLADPGLAHNANHLAAPGLGSSHEVEQHVHLALTPDERDQAGPVGVARHPAPQDAVGDAGPTGLAAGAESLAGSLFEEARRFIPRCSRRRSTSQNPVSPSSFRKSSTQSPPARFIMISDNKVCLPVQP